MNPALWALGGGVAAAVLVLLGMGIALLVANRRSAARERAAGASARAEVEALRQRLEELSGELAETRRRTVSGVAPEYLITDAGRPQDSPAPVPERAVLSVTLGEPLVKLAAFGYGLRKALSAESRNRIAFEMRREVKRARKERRRAARRTRLSTAPTEETAA